MLLISPLKGKGDHPGSPPELLHKALFVAQGFPVRRGSCRSRGAELTYPFGGCKAGAGSLTPGSEKHGGDPPAHPAGAAFPVVC